MKISQIRQLLDARVLCGAENLDRDMTSVFASDMMSDILACPSEIQCMLTGLVNQQVIRTADMMDVELIIFIRDKQPPADLITMADQRGMTVLVTDKGMYTACGVLFQGGFCGGEHHG